jgi:hypothetical protein
MPGEIGLFTMQLSVKYLEKAMADYGNRAAIAFVQDDESATLEALDRVVSLYAEQMRRTYSKEWNDVTPFNVLISQMGNQYAYLERLHKPDRNWSVDFNHRCVVKVRDGIFATVPKMEDVYYALGWEPEGYRFMHQVIGELMIERDSYQPSALSAVRARMLSDKSQDFGAAWFHDVPDAVFARAIAKTVGRFSFYPGTLDDLATIIEKRADPKDALTLSVSADIRRSSEEWKIKHVDAPVPMKLS